MAVKKGTTGYALNINDVFTNSFHNANGSSIEGGIVLTDSNGAGFENESGSQLLLGEDGFIIESNGDVNLRGDLKNQIINVNRAAKLTFKGAADIRNTRVYAKVAATRIIFAKDTKASNDTKIIAKADNIRVEVPAVVANQGLKFVQDGGKFVSVNDKNQTVPSNTSTGDAVDIGANKDQLVTGGVQDVLEKIDVLNGVYVKVGEIPTTVTAGAITTEGALSISDLKQKIKDIDEVAEDTEERVKGISASYTLLSNNLVEIKGDRFVKVAKFDEKDANSQDTLRVVLSFGGKTVRKDIKITKG